jgi:hypothetical protein
MRLCLELQDSGSTRKPVKRWRFSQSVTCYQRTQVGSISRKQGRTGAKLGSPTRVAVMTYNIYHGEDANGGSNLDAVAKIINSLKPDLVALQEVDKKTTRAKGLDLTAELSKRTGMKGVFGNWIRINQ